MVFVSCDFHDIPDLVVISTVMTMTMVSVGFCAGWTPLLSLALHRLYVQRLALKSLRGRPILSPFPSHADDLDAARSMSLVNSTLIPWRLHVPMCFRLHGQQVRMHGMGEHKSRASQSCLWMAGSCARCGWERQRSQLHVHWIRGTSITFLAVLR